MPRYSVATTRDNLSNLIDKALAGEEVIITRHGKPTAALSALHRVANPQRDRSEWMEWLRERRESRKSLGMDGSALVRQMRDDGAH